MKISLLVFLSGIVCLWQVPSFCKASCEEVVTIIIHGTVGLTETFNINTIHRLWRNTVAGSQYAEKVKQIRSAPKSARYQPLQAIGLRRIRTSDSPGAYLFAQLYRSIARTYHPDEKHIFYTFGWSGICHHDSRARGAKQLYNNLRRITKRIKEHRAGVSVKIRIIAFSHGAALACLLADVREAHPQDTFVIDELMCLGMPIIYGTTERVLSPLFRKVYHIYSDSDLITCLDIFSNNTFCSSRKFVAKMPKKVKQIRIRVMGPLKRNRRAGLPGRLRGTVDQSPNHMELWFFGTNNGINTRQSYIMSPLPISIFVPYIHYVADKYVSECCSLTVELWPHKETTYLRSCKRLLGQEPFISTQRLSQLQQDAHDFTQYVLHRSTSTCSVEAPTTEVNQPCSSVEHAN